MKLSLAPNGLFAWAFLAAVACDGPAPSKVLPQAPAVQVGHPDAQVDSTTRTVEQASAISFPSAGRYAQAELTFGVIGAPNGSYGYDIYGNGHLIIHQTGLPGSPGNEGCRTRADAEKLAAFVMEKIRKGEVPPTVTAEDLSALDIH